MTRTTCWSCGTSYDGWTCPGCEARRNTERQTEELAEAISQQTAAIAEAQRDAAEIAANAQREAAEYVAEQQKKNIAEAWKLEAQAKVDRAYELYRNGLEEDAVRLSLDAAYQDPGNLQAYSIASWGLQDAGKHDEARPLFDKQIALLSSADYQNRPVIFQSVLSGLPDEKELKARFSEALRMAAAHWKMSERVISLISRLVRADFLQDVQHLTSEALDRGVCEKNAEFLHVLALSLEAARLLAQEPPPKVLGLIHALPHTQRRTILEQFGKLKDDSKRLSTDVVNFLGDQIRGLYEAWRPAIERELVDNAKNQARTEAVGKGLGAGWAVGIGACLATVLLWSETHPRDDGGGFLLGLVVGIAAGIATTKLMRSQHRFSRGKELLLKAIKDENELLRSCLPNSEVLALPEDDAHVFSLIEPNPYPAA